MPYSGEYYEFESLRWDVESNNETTPVVTPGLFADACEVDESGQPIPSRLTKNIHWNEESYPGWSDGGSTRKECLNKERESFSKFLHQPTQKESVPFTVDEIAARVNDICKTFNFQFAASINVFELLMSQLDSRASRSEAATALRTLHADYIGGPRANYRKWYFASQMDRLDNCEFVEIGEKVSEPLTLKESQQKFDDEMVTLPDIQRLDDLIIWLFIWTEANQMRFMPECLCFIFKCARSFWISNDRPTLPTHFYLDRVITPLYECYRMHNFEKTDKEWLRRERDHKNCVGYDDMNQLFWYIEGIEKIHTNDGNMLVNHPQSEWFLKLGDVNWSPVFKKSFRETRTFLHLITNFSRIWILHGSVFWFYTAFNSPTLYTSDYSYLEDTAPRAFVRWTVMSFGGLIGPIVSLIALLGEAIFVPRNFPGGRTILDRLIVIFGMTAVLGGPAVYNLIGNSAGGLFPNILSGVLFSIAVIYALYFSFQPPHKLLGSTYRLNERKLLANNYFTANFSVLSRNDQLASWMMALLVLVAKLTESYSFLTLSIRDPIREVSILRFEDRCIGDKLLGSVICHYLPHLILAMMIITDMVLFFLDTYLWYVIFNTAASVTISFFGGASVWTPWRNVYSRLPQRMLSKLLSSPSDNSLRILWNTIIESMYKSYLLTRDQAEKLAYTIKAPEPLFFTAQEDGSREEGIFHSHCEAERRISFFAQSMSTPMPEPMQVKSMPAFTVLIPHYKEQIYLNLRETIRIDNDQSRVSILEYLQRLNPIDWDCFVQEQKKYYSQEIDENVSEAVQRLGFSRSSPSDTNRVRLWVSSRAQTLYRTVLGFMNYASALRTLQFAESNPDMKEVSQLVNRKFRIIIAMQQYMSFDQDELSQVELLFNNFPGIVIVYVDRDNTGWYSSLIDSGCPLLENGRRKPRIRMKISGNPILGDGKSDNQNHALPFYRGEYIQLVDANQDNYLEECLKIRNVLSEFGEVHLPREPYHPAATGNTVAIVGAREYIFSEKIGVLGDVAAGKEQTFGTLSARTLAKIGAKLHYGHPDFLNGVFMTTRGGVSKAQKGLHLNEDIYAGITALVRGGQIRHCEYYQCGKGRDLGFISILNFTYKIGAGMGEQMLSREYFWLGTQLPFDRFFSFYYAHPGFHLNNVFIMISLDFFLVIILWLSSIASVSLLCRYRKGQLSTDPHLPPGCKNVLPLIDWVRRCVLSIFVVFFISIVPLFFQELTEKGLIRSLTRIVKHFVSLSMLFEIFVTRIYSRSFLNDLGVGGAKYVATGRGFATSRSHAYTLWEAYADDSIYFGLKSFGILLFASMAWWHPAYLWFWVTTFALCMSPFIYNPHQFAWVSFLSDYRSLVHWFGRADASKPSWSKFIRHRYAKFVGLKQRNRGDFVRPSRLKLFISQVCTSGILMTTLTIPYCFVSSQREYRYQKSPQQNPCLRMAVVSLWPFCTNLCALIAIWPISLIMSLCNIPEAQGKLVQDLLATTVHIFGVLCYISSWWLMLLLERSNIRHAILGMMAAHAFQRFISTVIITLILPRQRPSSQSNDVWWSGKWHGAHISWHIIVVPIIELITKTLETTQFSTDYISIHFILSVQAPLLLMPYVDQAHSMLLLWLRPEFTIAPLPLRYARQRRYTALKYGILFVTTIAILACLISLPFILPSHFSHHLTAILSEKWPSLDLTTRNRYES